MVVPFPIPENLFHSKTSSAPSCALSETVRADRVRLINQLQVRILQDKHTARVVEAFIRGVLSA